MIRDGTSAAATLIAVVAMVCLGSGLAFRRERRSGADLRRAILLSIPEGLTPGLMMLSFAIVLWVSPEIRQAIGSDELALLALLCLLLAGMGFSLWLGFRAELAARNRMPK